MSIINTLIGDTSFWVMLSTALCFAFIAKKAKVPFLGALDSRAAAIRTRLEEAEALHTEAKRILEEYKQKSAMALHEAEEVMRNAERRAEHLRKEMEHKLVEAIARQEMLAKNRLERMNEEAMQSVKNAILVETLAKVKADAANNVAIPPRIDHSLDEVAKILQK